MLEGHAADAYADRAILAGIFNRLGDGRSAPLRIEPPAWTAKARTAGRSSAEELGLARGLFKQWCGTKRRK